MREADNLTTFTCRVSWNLGAYLEPSGPHWACNGNALPLPFNIHVLCGSVIEYLTYIYIYIYIYVMVLSKVVAADTLFR